MATVSERARELAEKYVGSTCMEHCWCQYSEKNGDDYVSCEDKLVGLIEQALLAARRLAMEEAAKIVGRAIAGCDRRAQDIGMPPKYEIYAAAQLDVVANAIRAAAEKEVGK